MNRSEAATILALASARDRRTIGETDVYAWAEDLADIDFGDARRAVSRHFRTMPEKWLNAAYLIGHVKAIRAEDRRTQPSEHLALPSRFETDEDRSRRLAAGIAKCRATLAGEPDPLEVPTQLLRMVPTGARP